MENLTFKYFGLESIYKVTSKELMDNIEYLQNSRIDDLPIFTTNNLLFEKEVVDILNYQHIDKLIILLRRNKLNKLLKNTEPSIEYEFLNFWYDNHEKLRLMLPM